jgi:Na+-transporting NADH:ubiquinone oxidoreductase subunit B/electron transport complex protein RnfD
MVLHAACLFPSLAAGVYFHGGRAVAMAAVATACAAAVELGFARVRRGGFALSEDLPVIGLLIALVMPSGTPLWMVAVGSVFGVFFGREVFGGMGWNLFHPALVAKAFLIVSWPTTMAEVVRSTVPEGETALSTAQALVSCGPGGIGECCAAAVIAGGVALVIAGIASWHTVVACGGAATACAAILHAAGPETYAPVEAELLSGSALFAVFFLVSDAVTSPSTRTGKWIYGALVGALMVLIRNLSSYGTYTEAATFAVLFGNVFASAIDGTVVAAKFRRFKR